MTDTVTIPRHILRALIRVGAFHSEQFAKDNTTRQVAELCGLDLDDAEGVKARKALQVIYAD